MNKKQKEYIAQNIYFRAENGVLKVGYYKEGNWQTLKVEPYESYEELGRKALSYTLEDLFNLWRQSR